MFYIERCHMNFEAGEQETQAQPRTAKVTGDSIAVLQGLPVFRLTEGDPSRETRSRVMRYRHQRS